MFLFWDLTSPSPPGEGGRKVRGTAVTCLEPFPSSHPLLVLSLETVRFLFTHTIAMAVLVSWSCPYSKLTLSWDLPQPGHHLPLKPGPLWPQLSLDPAALLPRPG